MDQTTVYISICFRLSDEMNTFLSPCIFLGAICITAFMITSVFQLSLVGDNYLKLLTKLCVSLSIVHDEYF